MKHKHVWTFDKEESGLATKTIRTCTCGARERMLFGNIWKPYPVKAPTASDIKSIGVKNYRSCGGDETDCFSAILLINGEDVAEVSNDGRGGCNMYHFYDHRMEVACGEYAKHIPPMPPSEGFDRELEYDLDIVISEVIERQLQEKAVERKLKTGVAWIDDSCSEGGYKTYDLRGYDPLRVTAIRACPQKYLAKMLGANPIFAHEDMAGFLDRLTGSTAHPRPLKIA